MDVLHSVSIPAGFTQCRWSTSRESSSPLQRETEYLLFPFLPPRSLPHPHHLTSDHFYQESHEMWGIKWKPSLRLLNPIYYPLLFFRPSSSLLRLPGGMVICPLRGGESVTCRLAPSSYDTRWHSTAVIASTKPGSGDQIIFLSASISHIHMCCTDNRSQSEWNQPNDQPVRCLRFPQHVLEKCSGQTSFPQRSWCSVWSSMDGVPAWVILLVKHTPLGAESCCLG